MDQLKEFLGVLRRQHFWIIAPMLLVVGLVGWMMATKRLTQEYEKNKTQVQSYISDMQTVSNQRPHPNGDYHNGMEKLISERRDNVRAAWHRKWERQKQELKWPEDLPADFVSRVKEMRAIESVDVNKRRIPSSLRRTYGSFIKDMLPRLAKRIGAKWEPSSRGFTGFEGGGFRGVESVQRSEERGRESPQEEEEPVLVEWNGTNQSLFEQRFNWGSNPPTTLDILYAQEDLWVLTTLIDIIKRTNGDAMIRSQAAIKAIDFIQIGKDVEPPSRQGFKVVRPDPMGVEDASEDDEMLADMGDSMEFGSESDEDSSELGDESPDDRASKIIRLDLVKNRYYDENYEPIADLETLTSSVTVAKRIPVRIRLLMNQREISKLLVECANAPLTFEVRQLRFDPASVAPGGSSGGENSLVSSQQKPKTLEDYQSFDRTVELFGIIYIFNPVDEAVLGGKVDDAGLEDDTAAMGPADRRTGWQSIALK